MNEQIDGETLEGVSATTLWTLRNRAEGALGPDPVIEDPFAVELYRRIAYDYDKFGAPSQSHPLRALAFDQSIRDYARTRPDATVVVLGEGLQTSFWRIADPSLHWVSVDLEPVIELRERLLPAEERITSLGLSALDRAWMDEVDPANGVVIAAEGLFMYLEEAEVMRLIADCARRFPAGRLIFDSIPAWFSAKTMKGLALSDRYTAPPMPFSLTVSQAARLPERIDGVRAARDVMLPPGRGPWGNPLLRRLSSAPILRDQRPSITELAFAD